MLHPTFVQTVPTQDVAHASPTDLLRNHVAGSPACCSCTPAMWSMPVAVRRRWKAQQARFRGLVACDVYSRQSAASLLRTWLHTASLRSSAFRGMVGVSALIDAEQHLQAMCSTAVPACHVLHSLPVDMYVILQARFTEDNSWGKACTDDCVNVDITMRRMYCRSKRRLRGSRHPSVAAGPLGAALRAFRPQVQSRRSSGAAAARHGGDGRDPARQ